MDTSPAEARLVAQGGFGEGGWVELVVQVRSGRWSGRVELQAGEGSSRPGHFLAGVSRLQSLGGGLEANDLGSARGPVFISHGRLLPSR
jgi:hypothetical protein